MGGQDLLPPAKAGGARRTSRSTPVRLTVLTSALIIACLLYTAQRTHRPDMVVVAYPVDHNHGIEALAGQHDSASPPPSLRPVTEAPAEAAAAAEAAAITVASPSIISLKLQTTSGKEHTLRLRLLPEHSAPSVEFMRFAATHKCGGELYRSEKDFLVQGRIDCPSGGAAPVPPHVVKGSCPAGVAPDGKRACPSHDPNCGCHGPVMSKGMVGWAGGSAGPDLFIYTATHSCAVGGCAATHWSRDHTVFAEVADDATWVAIEDLYALPVRRSGMTFFAEKIKLDVRW